MKLIDIGCFNGDSVLHFIANPDIDFIEAYDPNDSFEKLWRAISKHYPTITFHTEAVYTYDGIIEFTKRPANVPLGSTIMQNKHDWGAGEIIPVPCVDIAGIITEPCIIKMDAEGAEYDILERLIESGKDKLVDKIMVEWHGRKLNGDYSGREHNLIDWFGDKLEEWERP